MLQPDNAQLFLVRRQGGRHLLTHHQRARARAHQQPWPGAPCRHQTSGAPFQLSPSPHGAVPEVSPRGKLKYRGNVAGKRAASVTWLLFRDLSSVFPRGKSSWLLGNFAVLKVCWYREQLHVQIDFRQPILTCCLLARSRLRKVFVPPFS